MMLTGHTRILFSFFPCFSCISRRQLVEAAYNRNSRAYLWRKQAVRGLNTASGDDSQSTWKSDYKPYEYESLETDHDATYKRFGSDAHGLLYPEHIPTSLFQKMLLSAGAAAVAITSPARGDTVATLGETTGYFALVKMRQKMAADPAGRQILEDQPRISTKTVDLDYLKHLPEGTFGRLYSDWLKQNRCNPDDRLPVHFIDDLDLAYVMQRYREIHDLIHALLGMPTHMLGEVVVKWVEGLQFGLPMCLSGAVFGPLRLTQKQRKLFHSTHLPFAIRTGNGARSLMNVYYEQEWETPVEELRARLNIEQPPKTPAKLWRTS